MSTEDDLSVVTLILPDPDPSSTSSHTFLQLNSSISFAVDFPDSITVLSSTNSQAGDDISGLLYLPEIQNSPDCQNAIYNYVPLNTTSNAQLPQDDTFWTWIAVAPWISANCTLALLQSATDDSLRAFVFYLPDNTSYVPPPNDPTWDLGDGGKWKSWARFPVFTIAGTSGDQIIQAMAEYSGNLTSVPYGHTLADSFPPTAYVRLAGLISIDGRTTLPSLWVFLLIVLGLLMFIIASTSFGMHWLQRRRRERLRRRVANGEVDLEQLGIKKLTVPPELLEKMPLYNYPGTTEKSEIQETATTDPTDQTGIEKAGADIGKDIQQPTPTKPTTTPAPQTAYSQPTCAICLEDFVPSESLVRELPCRHIFHSECVDTFLRENSSLCPLCKKTSLPRGYCPPIITNVMVRRERMMRRMRDRVPSNSDPEVGLRYPWSAATWRRRGRSALTLPARVRARAHSLAVRTGRNATTESLTMTPALPPVSRSETAPRDDDAAATTTIAPPAAAVDDHGPGSEWARRRAVAMAGVQWRTDEDEERRPRWRRITGKIWPGLA